MIWLPSLNPGVSNDTETLGLWGAVHKRLWDKTKDSIALDKAMRSYERGFYLRNDYYSGINFAFLLNIRGAHAAWPRQCTSAKSSEAAEHRASAIADFVQAERVRNEVLSICDQWLTSSPVPDEKASAEARKEYLKNKYWVVVTKRQRLCWAQAKSSEANAVYEDAYSFAPESWMIESTKEQKAKLENLLADPPSKYPSKSCSSASA
ncbi:MAG: DUF4071 domain-containing protein [Chromatiales bacterium]|nr:DUF4071 domain-containing protein [Chromatiales bacterium]